MADSSSSRADHPAYWWDRLDSLPDLRQDRQGYISGMAKLLRDGPPHDVGSTIGRLLSGMPEIRDAVFAQLD